MNQDGKVFFKFLHLAKYYFELGFDVTTQSFASLILGG